MLSSDMKAIESFHMKCQRRILGISWHDFVRNTEVSCTGLPSVSDRITRGWNAIFSHVASYETALQRIRLAMPSPAFSRPGSADLQIQLGSVNPVICAPSGTISSAQHSLA